MKLIKARPAVKAETKSEAPRQFQMLHSMAIASEGTVFESLPDNAVLGTDGEPVIPIGMFYVSTEPEGPHHLIVDLF